MTSETEPAPPSSSTSSTDVVPGGPARVLALSGVAFAVLLALGWFRSAGDAAVTSPAAPNSG